LLGEVNFRLCLHCTAVPSLTPFAGGRALFGLGMLGASFVAALVVSIAGAYGISEAFGVNQSLNHRFGEAKAF